MFKHLIRNFYKLLISNFAENPTAKPLAGGGSGKDGEVSVARQLEAAFEVYVTDISPLVAIALVNGSGKNRATNRKYEWQERSRSRIQFTLAEAYTTGIFEENTPKPMKFIENIRGNSYPGDILRFETDKKIGIGNMKLMVVDIIDNNTANVVLLSGNDIALTAQSLAVFMNNSLEEGSHAGRKRNIYTPLEKYNFTQIIDTEIDVPRTVEGVNVYHGVGKLASAVEDAFFYIQRALTEMIIQGTRFEKEIILEGKKVKLYGAGGIRNFISNILDAGGKDVETGILDQAAEIIIKGGGRPNTLIMNTKQARKMAAIDQNKLSVILDDMKVGRVVTEYQVSIPIKDNKIDRIIIDLTLPEDEIIMLDISKVALIPLSNGAIRTKDSTMPGQDGESRRILGEYTVRFDNADETCVDIRGLKLPEDI